MNVILTCGIPGSGKSTWVKAFIKKQNEKYITVSRDDFRSALNAGKYIFDKSIEPHIKDIAMNVCRIMLFSNDNINIILDETNFKKSIRQEWIEFLKFFKCNIICVEFVDRDVERSLSNRMMDSRGIDNWVEVIDGMNKDFESPNYDEEFNEIWTVSKDQVLNGTFSIINKSP